MDPLEKEVKQNERWHWGEVIWTGSTSKKILSFSLADLIFLFRGCDSFYSYFRNRHNRIGIVMSLRSKYLKGEPWLVLTTGIVGFCGYLRSGSVPFEILSPYAKAGDSA